MARNTREAILTAAAELMRVKGYGAVGMKDIVAASGAPIGSLYHHFPRGKVQIAGEALVNAGRAYALLIPTLMNPHTDLGQAIESAFAQAAEDMAGTGFANMCPVGSVAAEVADNVEELRTASAGILTEWLDGATAYFAARGVPRHQARDISVTLIATLEGAFTVARTLRSTEPLLAAGRVLGRQYRGIALAGVSLPDPVGTPR
ncbi:MAG: TetR/AcrR family transcriptional regulator [Mycobacterium sp.]|nr:TetR/AcrR family transcriptional regulator [Mycobacterium sp.]